ADLFGCALIRAPEQIRWSGLIKTIFASERTQNGNRKNSLAILVGAVVAHSIYRIHHYLS
ncbi:MAG: hypothetical protein ACNY01_11875, partial [Desulfobacteria bacterium]